MISTVKLVVFDYVLNTIDSTFTNWYTVEQLFKTFLKILEETYMVGLSCLKLCYLTKAESITNYFPGSFPEFSEQLFKKTPLDSYFCFFCFLKWIQKWLPKIDTFIAIMFQCISSEKFYIWYLKKKYLIQAGKAIWIILARSRKFGYIIGSLRTKVLFRQLKQKWVLRYFF